MPWVRGRQSNLPVKSDGPFKSPVKSSGRGGVVFRVVHSDAGVVGRGGSALYVNGTTYAISYRIVFVSYHDDDIVITIPSHVQPGWGGGL